MHLLVNFPPERDRGRLVDYLKGVSSRSPRQDFADLEHHHHLITQLCSVSYYAGTSTGHR